MDVIGSVKLDSGAIIRNVVISNAVGSALEAIKEELPEEARTYEVYDLILDACRDVLREKPILL